MPIPCTLPLLCLGFFPLAQGATFERADRLRTSPAPQEPDRLTQEPSAEDPTKAPEGKGPAELAGISEARAAKTVRELVALGPRMGGTRSGEAAAKYLEQRFAGMGLATTRHLGREQWCHQELSWEVTVRTEGEEPYGLERAWPWGFSPGGSGVKVPLSVGDGRSEPGSDHALLTGSYMGVRRKGTPSNVVLVDDATTIDGEWPVCRSLRRRGTQAPTFGISSAEGARIRAAVAAGKAVQTDWSLETEIRQARPVTVVATCRARRAHPTVTSSCAPTATPTAAAREPTTTRAASRSSSRSLRLGPLRSARGPSPRRPSRCASPSGVQRSPPPAPISSPNLAPGY